VEVLLVSPGRSGNPSARTLGALATPRTCLLPRLPGAPWQYLAAADFSGACVLWRIDWSEGAITEAGRLPGVVDGGVWLDDAGHRLAVNLRGETDRTSVHVVDFEKTSYHLLFQVSPESEDRVVLFHPPTNRLVFTSDAFGYPGVGLVRLGDAGGVRFLPPLCEGEEAGDPCAFVSGGRAVLLRHEDGVVSRLHLADVETLEVGPPLAVPDGEIGSPVNSDGDRLVRFPFSTPDLPWTPAAFDLGSGDFRLEEPPGPAPETAPSLLRAQVTALPGPFGPIPALRYPASPAGPHTASDLAVVALHGGPIARWTAEYTGVLQLFAQLPGQHRVGPGLHAVAVRAGRLGRRRCRGLGRRRPHVRGRPAGDSLRGELRRLPGPRRRRRTPLRRSHIPRRLRLLFPAPPVRIPRGTGSPATARGRNSP
jgi:hypothetical protein